MSMLKALPIEIIANLNLPSGVGDKRILRLTAQMLGLKKTSKFSKRAIQFGSRIAKNSNKKCFGSNRKASGTALYDFSKKGDKRVKIE